MAARTLADYPLNNVMEIFRAKKNTVSLIDRKWRLCQLLNGWNGIIAKLRRRGPTTRWHVQCPTCTCWK